MVTKWDDYPMHQIAESFEKVEPAIREWSETVWFGLGRKEDATFIQTGIYCHPGVGKMVGYALTIVNNVQYNLRLARPIKDDRADFTVGPLSLTIVEPMSRWRVKLAENEHTPVTYNLEWQAARQPYPLDIGFHGATTVTEVPERYFFLAQTGNVSGTLTIKGKTYPVTNDIGLRDRSWGSRVAWTRDVGFHCWLQAMFKDYHFNLFLVERRDGTIRLFDGAVQKADGKDIRLKRIEHRLDFEPGSRCLLGGDIDLVDAEGKHWEMAVKALHRGNIWKGATLYGDWLWDAPVQEPYYEDGEVWDFNDEVTRLKWSKYAKETMCEFRCGDDVGYGMVENGFSRKHIKYGPMATA